ncbi:MFS transporter [bacterium]|nr:MFS transporter [bacterium]
MNYFNNKKVENAWSFYDWANSVYNLIITTAIFPIFYNAVTSGNKSVINGVEVDVVQFFGREFVNTEIYGYVFAFSFLVVVLMVPLLSGIAGYIGNKKLFMKFFCYLGAAACISLYWFDPKHLEWSMLSAFLASIGFWGSWVFYNSFLPEIADRSEHDRISAKGFSMGYIGSVLLLVAILVASQGFGMDIKIAFILVGIWWAGFAQYTYYHLPTVKNGNKVSSKILLNGYRELRKVWNELKEIASIKWYLFAYFVYNMGVQTVMLLAVTFAIKEINWPLNEAGEKESSGLIISVIIIQLIAIFGATFMSRLSKRIGNIKVLMLATMIWVVVTIIAYFIHQPVEFYILAGIVGFVMGGIQSMSRSTYSKMLPDTKDHASYFSFFDVMEKVGLIFGPFFFSFLEGFTGSMRNSVLMLMSFFIIGFVLLYVVLRQVRKEEKQSILAST